jgi:uncharacterized repeat protein (TIGR03943 family)
MKTTELNGRALNWAALIETMLLGCVGVMLLAKAQSGVLTFCIHPRYTPLIVVCGVVLLLVAGARGMAIVRHTPEPLREQRWRYLLLAIPLLLGTLVPAQPLGASNLSGTTFDAVAAPSADPLDDENTQHWNLFQWAMALSVRGDELLGREADDVGFVYHDRQQPLDGFFVVRYVVTCCTADGSGAALPVIWRDGMALPADGWVRVRGKIGTMAVGGRVGPALLAASVETVSRPDNPYLYP